MPNVDLLWVRIISVVMGKRHPYKTGPCQQTRRSAWEDGIRMSYDLDWLQKWSEIRTINFMQNNVQFGTFEEDIWGSYGKSLQASSRSLHKVQWVYSLSLPKTGQNYQASMNTVGHRNTSEACGSPTGCHGIWVYIPFFWQCLGFGRMARRKGEEDVLYPSSS